MTDNGFRFIFANVLPLRLDQLPQTSHTESRLVREIASRLWAQDPRTMASIAAQELTARGLVEPPQVSAAAPKPVTRGTGPRGTVEYRFDRGVGRITRIVTSGRGSYRRHVDTATLRPVIDAAIRVAGAAWQPDFRATRGELDLVIELKNVRAAATRGFELVFVGHERLRDGSRDRFVPPAPAPERVSTGFGEFDAISNLLAELPVAQIASRPIALFARERNRPAGIGISGLPLAPGRGSAPPRLRGVVSSSMRIAAIFEALGEEPSPASIRCSTVVDRVVGRMIERMGAAILHREFPVPEESTATDGPQNHKESAR